MRLGSNISERKPESLTERFSMLKEAGFSATFCPIGPDADDAAVEEVCRLVKKSDIVIAEVGAWSNPVSTDEETRRDAIENCRRRLALADRVGARCCVNISGSRGRKWDGPHPDNLTDATFDLVVETVRKIIDAVKPTRTFYTLEPMPWMYPDSPDAYVRLIEAIDRKAFAVHLDPVNLICSPHRYFANGALIRECFDKLGPHIRSCHAKDIILAQRLTTHLDECRPGLGALDYREYLRQIDRLDPDMPLMIEHLKTDAEIALAAAHIRSVAKDIDAHII